MFMALFCFLLDFPDVLAPMSGALPTGEWDHILTSCEGCPLCWSRWLPEKGEATGDRQKCDPVKSGTKCSKYNDAMAIAIMIQIANCNSRAIWNSLNDLIKAHCSDLLDRNRPKTAIWGKCLRFELRDFKSLASACDLERKFSG